MMQEFKIATEFANTEVEVTKDGGKTFELLGVSDAEGMLEASLPVGVFAFFRVKSGSFSVEAKSPK